MVDLSPGDFLYHSEQETFLVLIDEDENTYNFALHGWPKIDKDRIEQYINQDTKIHTEEEIEEWISLTGDDENQIQLNKLKQLFAVYKNADIDSDGAHAEFSFES